ncbi:MAG: undecaprenyl-diphosphate phosphatase [Deltaproteobacteria bacterium]|nr:undecaprenyl-diphosphate phosphatase [Deltaproteobacteria bacterium]
MSATQAVVLGLVEGITEYLPVSSTGHLLLAQRAMGIGATPEDKQAADAYAICIQLGAIVAVLGLYLGRVKQVLLGFAGRDRDGLGLGLNLIAAFVPAAILGLLFDDLIERHLLGLWPVVGAWFVGGAAILALARGRRSEAKEREAADLTALTWKKAVVIGVAQCLAMWPGTSRSLVTIVGGVLMGLSTGAAVEFSFLLGVLTLGAASSYSALKHGKELLAIYGWVTPAIGFGVAALSAVLAVAWMVSYLKRRGLGVFGYYRILVALGTAALLLTKVLHA